MKQCSCGSTSFENVDVTPIDGAEKKYFTRCRQCGLITAVYGCGIQRKSQTWKHLTRRCRSIMSMLG